LRSQTQDVTGEYTFFPQYFVILQLKQDKLRKRKENNQAFQNRSSSQRYYNLNTVVSECRCVQKFGASEGSAPPNTG